jgi:hypothetical protein
MFGREIFHRLHLQQPAPGALEFPAEPGAGIDPADGFCG